MSSKCDYIIQLEKELAEEKEARLEACQISNANIKLWHEQVSEMNVEIHRLTTEQAERKS